MQIIRTWHMRNGTVPQDKGMQKGQKEGSAQTTVVTCKETNNNFRVALARPVGLLVI